MERYHDQVTREMENFAKAGKCKKKIQYVTFFQRE